jgi:DNA invertase Pin-like site-specific DNA recombinase
MRLMTTKPVKTVVYLRTSTTDQRLGIDAQQTMVDRFHKERGWTHVRTFTEHESGKNVERAELDKAIRHARRVGAIVVVAKLDRLARNSGFLSKLIQGDVPIFFCDLPQVDGSPASKFIVRVMGDVAELERDLISQRTKDALAELKKQGKVLGNPANLTPESRLKGSKAGAAKRRANAIEHQADIAEIALGRKKEGSSLRQTAAWLNEEGYAAPKGGRWSASQVGRVLRRLPK